jgi:hypothetical protein
MILAGHHVVIEVLDSVSRPDVRPVLVIKLNLVEQVNIPEHAPHAEPADRTVRASRVEMATSSAMLLYPTSPWS